MAEQNIDFDQVIATMARFNEELIDAGVMWAFLPIWNTF